MKFFSVLTRHASHDSHAEEAKDTRTPNSSNASSQTDVSHIQDEEKGHPPEQLESQPRLTTPVDPAQTHDEITYPEGGIEAWLVVLGAFCGLTASLGIYNTSGVFSAVVSQTILPEETPSTLAWLFSIYAFVNWICGVQIGPTFDSFGPRALITAGTVCTLVGIFSLSVSTSKHSARSVVNF